MSVTKRIIYNLLDTIPESQLTEIADFIMFTKMKNEKGLYKDLEMASASSTDFWDNEIDDEAWNNV